MTDASLVQQLFNNQEPLTVEGEPVFATAAALAIAKPGLAWSETVRIVVDILVTPKVSAGRYTTTDKLRLRTAPNIPEDNVTQNVILLLPEGQEVTAWNGEASWRFVTAAIHGTLVGGWCANQFLKPVETKTPIAAGAVTGVG